MLYAGKTITVDVNYTPVESVVEIGLYVEENNICNKVKCSQIVKKEYLV